MKVLDIEQPKLDTGQCCIKIKYLIPKDKKYYV